MCGRGDGSLADQRAALRQAQFRFRPATSRRSPALCAWPTWWGAPVGSC